MELNKKENMLIDNNLRKMTKLRISITDACNMRCVYCLPKDASFMHSSKWLSADELYQLSSIFTSLGINQIRLTGGEPLLRKDFREIVLKLSALPLKIFGLTSNGTYLENHLKFLRDTNFRHINVSLDSLNENTFYKISNKHALQSVIRSIQACVKYNMKVKVNAVIIKNVNDHEIPSFLEFAKNENVEIRFLELMKIGLANAHWERDFVSGDEILNQIKRHYDIIPRISSKDSTAQNHVTSDGILFGVIASESKPFCKHCSRLRLSADGKLRACLMAKHAYDLKGRSYEQIKAIASMALGDKPMVRLPMQDQNMNTIGG